MTDWNIMDKPLILVTMGTNGYPFLRLAEYLTSQPIFRSDQVEWFIQTGGFEVLPPACGRIVNMVAREEMVSLVQRASLVVSHCGIGSLYMMLEYRKQVIFVPRVARYGEFSDDHQLQIANEIHNPRMKVIFPDDQFPMLELDEIRSSSIYKEPVNITNFKLADIIKGALLN
jgi:UDP-N-acetylglucosamine transferase subunit ALG13